MKKTPIAVLLGFACAAASCVIAAPTAGEIAVAYAPIIQQEVKNDQDFLASFDFDRNWNAYDNWEKQEWGFQLKGTVYYSVIESKTHWFVTYVTFHPRKWALINSGLWSHENDLQGAQLLVEKDGALGKPLVVEVWNGKRFATFRAGEGVERKDESFDGDAGFSGNRPVLRVSARSHEMTAVSPAEAGRTFKGVTYEYTGTPQEPTGRTGKAGYALFHVADTFWKFRSEVGEGKTYGESDETPYGIAGTALGGDTYRANAASMPWTWVEQESGAVAGSDWFMDPAHSFTERYELNRKISPIYTTHPYAPEQAPQEVLAMHATNFEALYSAE